MHGKSDQLTDVLVLIEDVLQDLYVLLVYCKPEREDKIVFIFGSGGTGVDQVYIVAIAKG
jgi:hypothetical protein